MNPLKESLKNFHQKYILIKIRRNRISNEKQYLSHTSFPELTKEEFRKIKQEWKGIQFSRKHINTHKIYKAMHGFDPKFLAMPLYEPVIIRKLNPSSDASVFANKGLFDIIFSELKQPKIIIKNIDNQYFNEISAVITKIEALDILSKHEKFIIKPINSYGGAKIKLIRNKISKQEIESLLSTYKKDFVVQEIIEQHPDTAKFNPESLNTIRVISLFLNGRVTILKSALRCGQNGSEVDNATSGGLMIKIKKDGLLESYGVDGRFEKIFKTNNNVQIGGQKIIDFYKIEEIVMHYHPKYYPSLHLIAWDFAIDKDGEPVFIEGNTRVPGIFWMQLCAGPIFGDLTKEVIEYVLEK